MNKTYLISNKTGYQEKFQKNTRGISNKTHKILVKKKLIKICNFQIKKVTVKK